MSPANDEHLYLEASQELDSGRQNPALWVKAMTLALGDEDEARYRYIALRVEQKSSTSEKIATPEPPTSPTPEAAEDLIPEDEIVHAGDAGPLESESELASRHGITFDGEQYHYQQYRYDRLSDAINYAELCEKRSIGVPPSSMPSFQREHAGPLESESELASRHGITFDGEQYHYQQYRYDRLSDAINYAELCRTPYAELRRKRSVGVPPGSKSPSTPIIQAKQWSVFTHPIYGQEVVPHNERTNWAAFFFTPIWHIATRTRHGAEILLALYGTSLAWNFLLLPRISKDIST